MSWLAPRWPATLFMRLTLAWCLALLAAHLINVLVATTRIMDFQGTRTSYYLAKDLSLLVPALEQATPAGRAAWLEKMTRRAYRFELHPAAPRALEPAVPASQTLDEVRAELGGAYRISASPGEAPGESLRVNVLLKDGSELTARVTPERFPLSMWGGVIFLLQALVMAGFTWVACRQATGPLRRLAEAAELLGASMQSEPIAEDGPLEVARAASAFNTMGRRIKEHLAERVRMLAAISHDLQTPIARMRLRADLTDDKLLRTKLHADLDAMQVLVEEGISYARSADRPTEAARQVDIGALLDTLVCDYADAGHDVALSGELAQVITTRPHALRRVVMNLADNALKFGCAVEIVVLRPKGGRLAVCVRDRGPGIAQEELEAVCQPFYRIESSRNRDTGGTGLGLAIARQLSTALDGTLTLANRPGGGLEAVLSLPIAP